MSTNFVLLIDHLMIYAISTVYHLLNGGKSFAKIIYFFNSDNLMFTLALEYIIYFKNVSVTFKVPKFQVM